MPPETTLNAPHRRAGIAFDADLGSALLIAESEDGQYEPVTGVGMINEAVEMARANVARRMKELDRGGEPMRPARYVVWARNADGDYRNIHEIEAD
jgi:hypothetical protein